MSGFAPQPPIGPPAHWSFPTPTSATLSNGIEVLTYHLPGQYAIAAHLVLDVPLNAEERDLEGVGTICSRVLDEGTRSHAGEEFAELLETEGAGFGVDINLSGLEAMLDVPATRLERALELFAEAVTEPALAAEDVDRHVQLRLAEIEQAHANSAQAASIAFRSAVFDPASRASRMNGGEPDTVARVTAEDVRQFHADYFGPRGATLVLAGDFGYGGLPSDPVELAERSFGAWRTDQRVASYAEPVPSAPVARLVDRPGSVQADVRLGGYGINRSDPRWADITVASYAMGGAFLSRLNAVLREEKGYTYGVRMQFSPMRTGGTFAVSGSFRTDVVAESLVEARRLLDVDGAPLTQREVDEAVAYFVGVSPLRYATADGVAEQAATQRLAGLGEDYVDANLRALRAVTPESATEAYQSLVHPDSLTLVVVGDAEQIRGPLQEAGFAL
ncbi:MAG TPA: pitrilysin family protein [Propionibacteriaceae bacterium]